jgi:hypothetical protein
MRRLARTCLPLAALLLVFAMPAAAPAGDDGPSARAAARTCHLSYREQTHMGTTYVLSLRVRITTCRNGKRVVKGFHKCRPGRTGRCRKRVFGYRCRERRYNKSSISYDSKVRCAKGSRRVWHTYQQNI